MGDFINPFDFRKIFLEYFLGNAELFIFAFFIIYSLVAAKAGFSDKIYLILLAISSIIFVFITGQIVFIIILIVISYVVFKSIGRLWA